MLGAVMPTSTSFNWWSLSPVHKRGASITNYGDALLNYQRVAHNVTELRPGAFWVVWARCRDLPSRVCSRATGLGSRPPVAKPKHGPLTPH